MPATPTPRQLTPRQLEVLELMARGLTNREIAGVLGIAAGTVKIHVSAIIDALQVSNRTEAALALQDFRVDGAEKLGDPVPGFGERPAIVVLPFDPLSPGEEAEWFADGLVDDLTSRIAAWRWLPVIARNTAFTYKGQPVDVARVGRELGVRYVIEGSARREGDRFRINVQLIDARSGTHVFAEIFDREVGDVFAVQDEIVAAVLGAIAPALLRFEQLQALARPKAEQTVWDRLYRGSFHLSKQTAEGAAEAIAIFDEVIAHSPEVALAHAGRSLAALGEGIRCVGESQRRPLDADEGRNALRRGLDAFVLAERGGRRAVELDDLDWTAHTALGWALMFQGRAAEALAPLERAVELNPSSATACFALGTLHLRDDADEAPPLLARAVRLSPRDPLVHMMYGALAGAEMLRGDFEAAFEAARRSVALEPEGGFSFRPALAVALAHLGREEEAKAVVDEVFRRSPGFNLGITRLVAPPRLIQRIEEGFARLGLEIG